MSTTENPFDKGPAQIDAERAIAFSERKAIRNGIIALSILLVLLLSALAILIRANSGLFPRQKVVYTTNAAAVCLFASVQERGAMTTALVEDFAASTAQTLYRLDYVNYRSSLSAAMDHRFTAAARADTTRAILSSGILETVVTQGFVLRALPDDRPAVLAEGIDRQEVDGITEDRYTWVVRVPLMLAYAYRGVSNTPNYRPEPRHVYMTIIRVPPTAENPMGVLVSKLVSIQPSEAFDISVMTGTLGGGNSPNN